MKPPSESPPSAEAVREELQRILAGRTFANAARARRFLTYIVEETLVGRQEGIKELVLGTEVFDRPSDFDPRLDTIVRVEAGKLRKRLDEHYQTEGAAASVRIEVPKGSYVPRFQSIEPAAPVQVRRPWRKYVVAGLAGLLIAAGAYFTARMVRPAPAPAPSIAVLPFLNFSPDPSNQYLADGIAEDLTDALARMGGIRVAARTSAFYFKGRQADVQDIGARLHVGFVVEGSVRKEGQRLKITAQLVRTDDGYHVWSRSFERDMRRVFAVQQEIAETVAATLARTLSGVRKLRPPQPHTATGDAFDFYLRGRHAVSSLAPTDINPAERLFQQSIAADPEYARPYLALAELYLSADILGLRPTRELVAKAKGAVQQALALDGESAEAHAVLGSLTARHEYNWAEAERHMREALELDPNSAMAHNDLAQDVLAPQGRWEEAMAENRRAIELDPFSPGIAGGRTWLLYLQRRTDLAIEGIRKLGQGGPPEPGALIGLGSALAQKGDYSAAVETFEQLQRLGPSPQTLAFIGYCHARAGRKAEAQTVLAEFTAQSRSRFVPPSCFAVVYIGLQDPGRAFEYLEKARQHQESSLIFTRVDSLFDPLRSDPRFRTLLEEIRLTDQDIQKNQSLASGVHR